MHKFCWIYVVVCEMLKDLEQWQTATWFTVCIKQWIVRLRDLLQGSLGYTKEKFREILRGSDTINYIIMALDNNSCSYYLGSEFSVWWRGRCGDSPDDEVFCPWGILIIKVSPVFYWESNLLNTCPPPTLFPNHLFLGEPGGMSNSEISRKFLRCCFTLLSPFCQREALS